MKKKSLSVLIICLMLVLAGCSSNQNTTIQSSEGITVSGEVVSITDNSLTLAVGTEKTMGEGQEMPEGEAQKGDKPGDRSGDMDSTDESIENDTTGSDTVEAESLSYETMPTGERPSGESPSMLDLTGEELTITIDENTVINSSNGDNTEDASVSDINEGTVVSITYDESNMTAATITIKSMGFGGGGPSRDQSEDITESSTNSL